MHTAGEVVTKPDRLLYNLSEADSLLCKTEAEIFGPVPRFPDSLGRSRPISDHYPVLLTAAAPSTGLPRIPDCSYEKPYFVKCVENDWNYFGQRYNLCTNGVDPEDPSLPSFIPPPPPDPSLPTLDAYRQLQIYNAVVWKSFRELRRQRETWLFAKDPGSKLALSLGVYLRLRYGPRFRDNQRMWRYGIMRGLLMVPELHRFICPAFAPVPFRFHWERAFIWDLQGLQAFCKSLHGSYVDVLVSKTTSLEWRSTSLPRIFVGLIGSFRSLAVAIRWPVCLLMIRPGRLTEQLGLSEILGSSI